MARFPAGQRTRVVQLEYQYLKIFPKHGARDGALYARSPPERGAVQRIRRFVFALLRDFGPLIVFVVANHFFGTKLAIAASMTAALAEFGYCKYRKQQLKTFFCSRSYQHSYSAVSIFTMTRRFSFDMSL